MRKNLDRIVALFSMAIFYGLDTHMKTVPTNIVVHYDWYSNEISQDSVNNCLKLYCFTAVFTISSLNLPKRQPGEAVGYKITGTN